MNPHRSAIDHILTLVGGSPLADVLVLRGSVTMLAWAGPLAREPGDLDWVVRPQWLGADQATRGACEGKDLYDAVLLAEMPGMRLSPRLRRMPGVAGLDPVAVSAWTVTDHPAMPGAVTDWLDRLAAALPPLLSDAARANGR